MNIKRRVLEKFCTYFEGQQLNYEIKIIPYYSFPTQAKAQVGERINIRKSDGCNR